MGDVNGCQAASKKEQLGSAGRRLTLGRTLLGRRLGGEGSEVEQQSCLNSGLALALPKGDPIFPVSRGGVSPAHLVQIQARWEPGARPPQPVGPGGVNEGQLFRQKSAA